MEAVITEPIDKGGEAAVTQAYWKKAAREHARRVNLGWWALYAVPLTAGSGMLFALLWLPIRRWELLPASLLLQGFGCLLMLCASVAYWRARGHFIGELQALARLDAICHLHNRLSSAVDGVGRWPAVPEAGPTKPHWNAMRTMLPVLASLVALFLAAFIPLQTAAPSTTAPPARELSAWSAVDASIELLRDQDIVKKDALEQVREQLDSLRAQPRENWYRPGSMEASDHLREQVGQAARDLQQALDQATAALAAATRTQLADHERTALLEQLGEALDRLQQGMLPLDPETLDALSRLASLDGLKGVALDPEALKDLLETCSQQAGHLGECASLCRVDGRCNSACTNGQCMAQAVVAMGMSEASDGASGGISRDAPGNTPLTFREPRAPLQAGTPEALSNRDLRQAALGDTVGVSTEEHEVDRDSWSGAHMGGGAAASAGQGGEAVWRSPVMPQEQAVLKTYFE